MEITSAEFVISNTDVKKCPAGIFPEYAFIGRSNLEYMEAFLDRFQKTFGTVEEYLRGIGLTGEEIEALRAKLLRP